MIDLVNITSTWREIRCSVKWASLGTTKGFNLYPIGIGYEKTTLNMMMVINGVREEFDIRHSGPGDTLTRLEVPTTWHEWDDFFIHQLFGPMPIRQVSRSLSS